MTFWQALLLVGVAGGLLWLILLWWASVTAARDYDRRLFDLERDGRLGEIIVAGMSGDPAQIGRAIAEFELIRP